MSTWSTIQGHELVIQFLQRAMQRGRVSHAYAFVGPRGIGKATVARLFVQDLLCPEVKGARACSSCRTCRRIERGIHPDVHHVQPDGEVIRIEQIRQLQNTLALKPFEALRKAAILDGADQMTTAAQNSLLKTLEEPPGDTYFLLIVSNPAGILPTIWSRCQTLRFQPLPRKTVVTALINRGIDEDKAHLLAALTEGRLGEALAVADKDVVELRDHVAQWVDDLAHPRTGLQSVLRIGQALEEQRDKVEDILSFFLLWLRDILLVKEGLANGLANQDVESRLHVRAKAVDRVALTQAMGAVEEARRHLQANANFRLTMDVMLTKVQRSFMHDYGRWSSL